MGLNKLELRLSLNFIRDVYGWMVPAVLLLVTVLSMAFLRPAAFSIIVLPFVIVFILTLAIGYSALGWFGRKELFEERIVYALMFLSDEGGEITMSELAENQSCTQGELARALHILHEIGLLSFFWDTRSGRIYVPRAARVITHCPQCAADIPAESIRGQCRNCHVYFVRRERKQQFCDVE
jgi:hypothetical protein